jgi:hypothetical protein
MLAAVLQKLQHRLAAGVVSESWVCTETAAHRKRATRTFEMNTYATPSKTHAPVWPPATQAERDRMRDAAVDVAHALRSAAIAEFWHGADALVLDAVDHGRRAADRLAARLRQHARQRNASHAATEL